MRQSRLFSKTLRTFPKDEQSTNAQLLIRGGFISKVMAGVYEYLPLGLRVLDRINAVIREEMNATGAEELYLSVLQNKETWETTGRWTTAREVMYQFKDAAGKDTGLGWTHEEPITEIARHFISSWRDLPKAVYQIQTKFRNEPRAKAGLLRGREFLMKDLYSFHADEKDLDRYYERVAQAYAAIFKRLDLEARRTLASGGLFSKYSDEFQVLSEAGEDTVFFCERCPYAANKEVARDLGLANSCPSCADFLREGRSIEVGNIFKLGSKFSEAFGLHYRDEGGRPQPVIMASYGIGPGRVLGTIVETHHDQNGIIWPENAAPFDAHLVPLPAKDAAQASAALRAADELYAALQKDGLEVLYDDRQEASVGEKFADADLLGLPLRLVLSQKTLERRGVELKRRKAGAERLIPLAELSAQLRKELAKTQ